MNDASRVPPDHAKAAGLAANGCLAILEKLLQKRSIPPVGRTPRLKYPPAIALRPDSSVVERGPEKAGVGGSIPSLATI